MRRRSLAAVLASLTFAACTRSGSAPAPPATPQAPPGAIRNAAHLLAFSSQIGANASSLTAGPILAVSGSIGPGKVIAVDPVYALRSNEATDDGPYEIAGFDASGREMFRTHFDVIGHAGTAARPFAVKVPLSQKDLGDLASLRVRAGGAQRTVVGTRATDPHAGVFRDRAGRFEIAWDAKEFPEIAITSAPPGSVFDLALATGGHALFGTPAHGIVVDFSNGLRSYRKIFTPAP
ncbi:MAG: hypothetical protein ACLQPV_02455 [Vulcanimicrobiaceae bacterium]